MGPALADLGISILVGANLCRDGAKCFGIQSSSHALHLLRTQGTSASANQHSVIHFVLLSLFRSVGRPKLLTKNFPDAELAAKPVALSTRHLIQKIGVQEQTGPHSPMEASPSLFGQTFVGTVQTVSVCIPPPTRAISSSPKERAPLRINTLFWSFMFSFLSSFWVR